MYPAISGKPGELRLTHELQDSLRKGLQSVQTQGGSLAVVHQRGDGIARGADGERAIPKNGFISLAPGESVHDETRHVADAKRGMKLAAALVLTALGAGTVGYLANEIWYRNRIVAPLGAVYGGYGMYGGYGGFGGYGW